MRIGLGAGLCCCLVACPERELSRAEQAAGASAAAEVALQSGDLASAEAAFTKAASLAPLAPTPALKLGEIRLRQGKDAHAVLDLKRAAELAPTAPRPRVLLGEAYTRTGRNDLALAAYEQAVELGDAGARLPLVRARLRMGKLKEASSLAALIAAELPEDGTALAALADTRAAAGDDGGAAELYDRAVKTGARDLQVRLSRARFFLRLGKAKDAATEAAAAQALSGSSKEGAVLLSRALSAQGLHAEAGKAISVALEARVDDPDLVAALAETRLRAGDLPGALADADRALQLVPSNREALLVRAQVVERTGEQAAAIRAYEEAARAGADPEALSRLAALYRATGQKGSALSTLEQLLLVEPGRFDDAVALCELRAETGADAAEGLTLLRRLREERPGDLKLLALQQQLEGIAAKSHGAPKGPQILRGGR